MITVALVDDHPATRNGLKEALAADKDISVVAEAGSGAELPAILKRRPDVLLLDLSMGQFEPFEDVPRIRAQYPEMKIVIVTAYGSVPFVKGLLPHVHGYLLKTEGNDAFAKAVHAVMEGKIYTSEGVLAQAISSRELPQLSNREIEVLTLAAQDLNSVEIGAAMSISSRTVDSHIESACEKLGVRKRQAAIVKAIEQGWIKPQAEESRA
jgi:DNA-binding NarL/FixJ family response regulator